MFLRPEKTQLLSFVQSQTVSNHNLCHESYKSVGRNGRYGPQLMSVVRCTHGHHFNTLAVGYVAFIIKHVP